MANNPRKNAEGYPDPTPYEALKHTKNPKRQAQGARAKAAGKRFEDTLDAACEHYQLKGEAAIEKTPEPMRPTKALGQGKFIAFYIKHAQPDYTGTLLGGRSVMFEAKHTDDDRIDQKRVLDGQGQTLSNHHRMGALCFVVVSIGSENFYRVPWPVWQAMKESYNRKYMTAEELEPYRITYHDGIVYFLDGLEGGTP